MTGPNVPNEELIAGAHEMVLEGEESEALSQQVSEYVGTQKTNFDEAMANAQAEIDRLSADALPAEARQTIKDALTTAKGAFDNSQRVLTAIITPPETSLPE